MASRKGQDDLFPPVAKKNLSDIIDTPSQDALIRICQANNVTYAAIFGSVARGTAKAGSDLDLLVKFNSQKSLIDLIRLEEELSEALGRKIDLVTEKSLSPYIRQAIQGEVVVVYAER